MACKASARLIAITFLGLFPGFASAGWRFENVDPGQDFEWTSLKINSGGTPRIAYGRNQLCYAVFSGGSWQCEVVDASGAARFHCALALDSSGHPAISHYDLTNRDLRLKRWGGPAWRIETVDSAGDVGLFTSIVFDPSGFAAISYLDGTNQALKCARWDGVSWRLGCVNSAGLWEDCTSIAFDGFTNPAIAYIYHDEDTTALRPARWNGTVWEFEKVYDTGPDIPVFSLVLDSSGFPRIAFGPPLRLAWKSDWNLSILRGESPFSLASG
jgi:hypothetical protein